MTAGKLSRSRWKGQAAGTEGRAAAATDGGEAGEDESPGGVEARANEGAEAGDEEDPTGEEANEAEEAGANEGAEAGEEGGRTPESTPGWDTTETVANDSADCVSTSLLAAGSTSSLKWRKKSTPKIGKDTAANKKVHWNCLP